jgi:hypothetical protein
MQTDTVEFARKPEDISIIANPFLESIKPTAAATSQPVLVNG